MLLAPLAGFAVPLLPGQILWINMLTHGLPGVAFSGEPLDPTVMSAPSPSPTRSVLDRTLALQILFAGGLVTAGSLAAGVWASRSGGDVRTAVFLTLGLGQLFVALALRAPRTRGSWRWHERGLELAVLGAAVLQLAGAVTPGLNGLLGSQRPGVTGLGIAIVLAAVPGLGVALTRRGSGAGHRSR